MAKVYTKGKTQYVPKGANTNGSSVLAGFSQVVQNGGKAFNTNLAGTQIVQKGGYASGISMQGNAILKVLAGGSIADIYNNGGNNFQYIQGTAINGSIQGNGNSQIVSGGTARNFGFGNWGSQILMANGKSYNTNLWNQGRQSISKGGISVSAFLGRLTRQDVYSGGLASSTYVATFASQMIYGGTAKFTNVDGAGKIGLNSGKVISATIAYEGRMVAVDSAYLDGKSKTRTAIASDTILNLRGSQILSGAYAVRTRINAGYQLVSDLGLAASTTINSRGKQVVESDGVATGTVINARGLQTVNFGGMVSATTIKGNGQSVINYGGAANKVTVEKSGNLGVAAGAVVSNLTLKSGGILNIADGAALAGNNSINGGKVTAAANFANLRLNNGANLNLGSNSDLSAISVTAPMAKITVSGTGNSIGDLSPLGGSSPFDFNISTIAARTSAFMLTISSQTGTLDSDMHKNKIITTANQQTGVYRLTKGIYWTYCSRYTIQIGATILGEVSAGDNMGEAEKSVTNNGINYKLGDTWDDKARAMITTLTLTAVKGRIATAAKTRSATRAIAGSQNCDVFLTGTGNETLSGNGGRDVAVYGKSAWGKDTIKQTATGTMTVLFNGISAREVSSAIKGKDMIITRLADKNQQITLKNYNKSNHSIVFGGTLHQVNKYLAAVKPAAEQGNPVYSEVWKKAGILA